MTKQELKNCPICGKPVEVHGGPEEWSPTWCDADSGGDPLSIHCDCGLSFCIGFCDISEFIQAWNIRSDKND